MKSVAAIQREVEKIRQKVKPPKDVWVRFSFPVDRNQPYGRYGHCLFNVLTRGQKAISEEDEVLLMKEFYEKNVPEHAKRDHDGYSWKTFEAFLKHHEHKST